MAIIPWKVIRSIKENSYKVFDLRIDTAISPRTNREYDFYVLETTSWVNIIPLTKDNEVIFVKQYRHGIRDITLEIPGGMVEHNDTPYEAALRELSEETGYFAEDAEFIGKVHPNPAILNNECYTYLTRDVINSLNQNLDEREDIDVELIPLSDVISLIKEGKITHSLVICAFYFLTLRYPSLIKGTF